MVIMMIVQGEVTDLIQPPHSIRLTHTCLLVKIRWEKTPRWSSHINVGKAKVTSAVASLNLVACLVVEIIQH